MQNNVPRLALSVFSVAVLLAGCSSGSTGLSNESSSRSSNGVGSSARSSLPPIPESWNRYVGGDLSFAYPADLLNVTDTVILSHAVPSDHIDPCDFKGDAPRLKELTDVHIKIEQTGSTLLEAVASRMHWTATDKQQFTENGGLVTSEGFIEEANFAHVHGYKITQGVEGCGNYLYFLENAKGKTVIVTRKIITELSGVVTNTNDYLKIPDIISPQDEEKLFGQILTSLAVQ